MQINDWNNLKSFVEALNPDWDQWVPVTATRNWIIGDPILDWLDLYGSQNGFVKDSEEPTFIRDADFGQFIKNKGIEFESRVLELLNKRIIGASFPEIVCPSGGSEFAKNKAAFLATLESMKAGASAISQGVLWNWENQTYGAVDLLVILERILLLERHGQGKFLIKSRQ